MLPNVPESTNFARLKINRFPFRFLYNVRSLSNLAGLIWGHQNKEKELGEVAQQSKALTALTEGLGLVPSIHSSQLPVTLVLGIQFLFWPPQVCVMHIQINKINKNKFLKGGMSQKQAEPWNYKRYLVWNESANHIREEQIGPFTLVLNTVLGT